MTVSSPETAKNILKSIGYYRLRGYCFQWYDNQNKRYKEGTTFDGLIHLYEFDTILTSLLFSFILKIEVSLRARITDALLLYNDALILMDPSVFLDKELYWKNLSSVASEISRSNDVFIRHNYENHKGEIPLWAAVEVITFGNLSKIIKNLQTGPTGAFAKIASNYCYKSPNGNDVVPSKKVLTSWIHAVSILRNICAHSGRIYNRAIATAPEILKVDAVNPQPRYNGLYQSILAMKYLRPDNNVWYTFVCDLDSLINQYNDVVELSRLNFPGDWRNHLSVQE